jgi:hypothetical protein
VTADLRQVQEFFADDGLATATDVPICNESSSSNEENYNPPRKRRRSATIPRKFQLMSGSSRRFFLDGKFHDSLDLCSEGLAARPEFVALHLLMIDC